MQFPSKLEIASISVNGFGIELLDTVPIYSSRFFTHSGKDIVWFGICYMQTVALPPIEALEVSSQPRAFFVSNFNILFWFGLIILPLCLPFYTVERSRNEFQNDESFLLSPNSTAADSLKIWRLVPAILFSSFCSVGSIFLLLLLDKTNILPPVFSTSLFYAYRQPSWSTYTLLPILWEDITCHCRWWKPDSLKLFVLPLHLI